MASEISNYARLVVATRNAGKVEEIKTLLGSIGLELVFLDEFDHLGIAAEEEDTYVGNAISKAKYYAAAISQLVLADDSGLEVAALGGAPGVLSARYAGPSATNKQRRQKLLRDLAVSGSADRSARFVCAVVVASPNQEILKITEGSCEGSISEHERGASGFGYDPIFIPNGFTETFGELTDEIKNQISHRARAIAAMKEFLSD